MNLATLLAALKRRWYLVLTGALATGALVLIASLMVPATYTATGSLLLIPPKTTVGPRGNPYLNLGGLGPAVDVLATRVMAGDVARQMQEAYPDAEITVKRDFISSGPILLVSTEAPTAKTALQLRDTLSADVAPTLAKMQREVSVAASSRITSSALASDEPDISRQNQLRAVIVALGVGLLLTVLGTALIDGILIRRPGHRGSESSSSPSAVEPRPGWSWGDADAALTDGETSADRPSTQRSGSGADLATKSRPAGGHGSSAPESSHHHGKEADQRA